MNSSKKLYKFVDPYSKKIASSLEIDSTYIHISNLKINSNRKRPIYKVINPSNKKFVLRKLRGLNTLKGNEVTFDKMTFNELDLDSQNVNTLLQPVNGFKKYITYFWFHPKEDIRIGYKFFLLGLVIGLVSIILGILSLFE